MAVLLPGRARRTARPARAAVLATLAVLLAGCTGDAEPAGEEAGAPQSPVEAIRALPDAGEVEAAVSASAEETAVPEDVVPPLPLIGNHGVLSPLEQRCVRDYGASQIPDLCTLGAPGAERRIVLWGDTRAAMWMPALTRIAEQTGYHLVTITQMQCPPLVGLTPWLAPEQRPYDECEATNANTVEAINTVIQPDLVVLAGAVRNTAVVRDGRPVPLGNGRPDNTWTPDRASGPIWQDGLERTITSIQDAEVFVLGEAPYLTEPPSVCLPANEDATDTCGVSRDVGVYAAHDERVRRTTEENGATYVSPLPWLCTEETCPVVIDGHVAYRDTFHLNRQYVLHISRALGAAIGLDDFKDLRG